MTSYQQFVAILERDGVGYTAEAREKYQGNYEGNEYGAPVYIIHLKYDDEHKVVTYGDFYADFVFDQASGALVAVGIYE